MYLSRNIATLTFAVIAFLVVATALRISESRPVITSSKPSIQSVQQTSLTADPSFLESTESSSDSKPSSVTVTPVVPAVVKIPSNVVTADAYIVGDVSTGKIYMAKNQSEVLPFASMSKLITAIVATDTMTPTTSIEVTGPETEVYPDSSALQAGEYFTVNELLYPLLLNSSNVAAEVLASSTDRAHFLNTMNSYAWEIGMDHTYFGDPSGLSSHNMGTAEDFFVLSKYIYSRRPDLLAITRVPKLSVSTTTEHGPHDFVSIHPFVTDPRFLGGKTGHTPEALDTMLTILNISGHPISFVLLHSDDRERDTQLLIDKVKGMI